MWEPQGLFAKFILNQPVLFHGEDAVQGLYAFPANRVAVIHGRGMQDSLREALEKIFKKQEVRFLKKSWVAEPHFREIEGTLAELEQFAPDVIIAVGGGSVIDGAKLCRLLYEFPYFDRHESRVTDLTCKTRFVAIPTTFGSGAEVSSAIMVMDDETMSKQAIVSHQLQPQVIVYDPQYLAGAGRRQEAASMLDAIAHLVEGYLSKEANPWAEILATTALSLVRSEVPRLVQGRADGLRLQYIGYAGGIVQNHCLVGAAHAIAHQLGGKGFTHGVAVGLLLKRVLQHDGEEPSVKAAFLSLLQDAGFVGGEEFFVMLDAILDYGELTPIRATLRSTLDSCEKDEAFWNGVFSDPGGRGSVRALDRDFVHSIIEDL